MSLGTSSCSSDDVERGAHDATTGYKLRKRSRETRNKMARMARALYEEDDEDYSSDSCSPVPTKQPRSHVRVSATRRERARMHKLNNAYDKLRKVVPKLNSHSPNERLSKIATLRLAIDYITMLTDYLKGNNEETPTDNIENSADEDTVSSVEDDNDILAKLIDSVAEEFGWFAGEYILFIFLISSMCVSIVNILHDVNYNMNNFKKLFFVTLTTFSKPKKNCEFLK